MADDVGPDEAGDLMVRAAALAERAYSSALAGLAERGFGRSVGFGDRPAVISVDWINAFTDPAFPTGSCYDAEVAASRQVLDAARAAGAPVFLVTSEYEPLRRDAGVWELKLSHEGMYSGSGPVQLDDRLGRCPSDQIVVKKYPSCFFGTDIASRLVSQRVDTVVLVGATTSGCVRASAVDSCSAGFRTIVVREAVGDRLALSHFSSLFDIDLKYGDVLSVAEVLPRFTKAAEASSQPGTANG
jgi:maleamate amidohydrolase